MYTYMMAQVTIYLPDELRGQVRHAGIPVSHVCQRALRRELASRQRRQARKTSPSRRDGRNHQEAA